MAHCLRDTYTDENKVSKFLNDASYDRVTLNELVNQMRSSRYPLTSVEALKAVSPTTVNNFVKSHKEKYIQQAEALFIPDEAITERLKQMDKVCEELSDLARKINDLLAKYEGVALKIDSKGAFWWDEKQLKALAQKQATTAFNELDKQYYQLLGACVDALEALQRKKNPPHYLSYYNAK